MTDLRYPTHGRCGAAPRSSGRRYNYCGGVLVPPEAAGLGPCDGYLLCTAGDCPLRAGDKVTVVDATPDQVDQARAAARADGTWPESGATS